MGKQTIVFIHGAHVTGKCWESFIPFFEAKGYECLAPNWPYDDRPIEDLRTNPSPELGTLGITEITAHFARFIEALDSRPIIIGHSFGGLFTQLLLNRGLGAAGVALDPAPTKGVFPTPAAVKSNMGPLAAAIKGQKTILMSEKDFGEYFANGISAPARIEAYGAYVVPTPTRIFTQAATAPFHSLCQVDYKKADRAPLLITAGGRDNQVPAGMIKTGYKKYGGPAVVALKEFPDHSHTLILEPGWQEVAEYVAAWLENLTL